MAIVSSIIVSVERQVDQRRRVVEAHTDQHGTVWPITYLAELADDIQAILTARASILYAGLTAQEIESNIRDIVQNGSLATPTLRYSTLLENGIVARGFYATATRTQAIMMGDFLSTLSNAQLQTAFSMTAGQVNNLRTNKLTPATSLAASIRAATGA